MNRRFMWIAIGILALGVGISAYQRYLQPAHPIEFKDSDQIPTVSEMTTNVTAQKANAKHIYVAASGKSGKPFLVQIEGGVKRPGIYQVDKGTRVSELIADAGGTVQGADTSALNMAGILKDGQRIRVPIVGVENLQPLQSQPLTQWDDDVPAKVNVNTASKTALMTIPGVGPAMADKIIAHRKQYGSFAFLSDLKKVKGIGDAFLKKVEPWIRL